MNGSQLVFDIDEISLLDINRLVDADRRFRLIQPADEQEIDNLEDYYEHLSASISKSRCDK